MESKEEQKIEEPNGDNDSTDSVQSNKVYDGIVSQLKEVKKISEISIGVYLRNLKKLNNNNEVADLEFKFLKDTGVIMKKLDSFKATTIRNYLISIVSILSLYKDIPDSPLKALHDQYHSLMMVKKTEVLETNSTGERSETQENNWINWNDVKDQHKTLGEKVNTFYKKKSGSITPEDFQVLTAYMILSLYTLVSPRRNKDYTLMRVVNTFTPEMAASPDGLNFNYLDLTKKKMIFNNYKTSKKYGRFDLAIPRALMIVINKYIKHRAAKFPLDDNDNKPFLIKPDGSALDKSNDITKTLNKVFGKAIGCSMLRHIFLTDKYSTTFKQAKIDAEIMGHSSAEQKNYIKEKLTIEV